MADVLVGKKNNEGMRLSEALPDFLIYLEATGRSEDTIKNYFRSLEWLKEVIKDPPLKRISGKDICSAIEKKGHRFTSVNDPRQQ
jgi:hypothetical protein